MQWIDQSLVGLTIIGIKLKLEINDNLSMISDNGASI